MTKSEAQNLPPPICPLGYPRHQVEEILGDKTPKFWAWFRGQTGAICECAGHAHGPVVYSHDLLEFIRYGGKVTTDW